MSEKQSHRYCGIEYERQGPRLMGVVIRSPVLVLILQDQKLPRNAL